MNQPPTRFAWLTRDRCQLAAVLILTLLVRGGVLWVLRGNLAADPDAYRQIAENLLRHGVFAMGESERPQPTAYRPPLYPVVLSNLPDAGGHQVSLSKVAVLHVLLGVATVWLTWVIARRVGPATGTAAERWSVSADPPSRATNVGNGGPAAGAALSHPTFAALLVACDPILLNQQSLVMTETLATFLAALALWCLCRFSDHRSWFWSGLSGCAIGLAALCRPTFLPWLLLVAAAMLIVRGQDSRFQISDFRLRQGALSQELIWSVLGSRLVSAVALLAVTAGIMSLWVMRNYRMFGKPIATTTHGGYTLYLGNNASFYAYLDQPSNEPWDAVNLPPLPDDVVRQLDAKYLRQQRGNIDAAVKPLHYEVLLDDVYYQGALAAMAADRRSYIKACLYRLGQLWSPLPHKLTANESSGRRLLRYATCAWYCGVYALAAVGLWRLRWQLVAPPWIWGLLLCLAFTAVHTFYWTNLRMRAPLMPFVALVAAAAVLPGITGYRRLPS